MSTYRGYHKIVINGETFCDYNDLVEWPESAGGPNITREMLALPSGSQLPSLYLQLGNVEVTFSPKVTITWPDNQQSWNFYMTCVTTFAGVSDVLITHIDINGVESTYKIPAASVSVATENPSGPTTVSKLTIKGAAPVLQ